MENKILLSICVPTYNRVNVLKETLPQVINFVNKIKNFLSEIHRKFQPHHRQVPHRGVFCNMPEFVRREWGSCLFRPNPKALDKL